MSRAVRFVFVGEGSTDAGLIPHLERLCIAAGAKEASGVAPDYERLPRVGHSVVSKLAAAIALEPTADLFFVHRDADSPASRARYAEIAEAAAKCQPDQPVVAVVPVQETETWLLVDETAIRRAVGNASGRVALALPTPGRAESLSEPKERLHQALIDASEQTGRRLQSLKSSLPTITRMLLRELSLDGPHTMIPSWSRLRQDVIKTVNGLVEVPRS